MAINHPDFGGGVGGNKLGFVKIYSVAPRSPQRELFFLLSKRCEGETINNILGRISRYENQAKDLCSADLSRNFRQIFFLSFKDRTRPLVDIKRRD